MIAIRKPILFAQLLITLSGFSQGIGKTEFIAINGKNTAYSSSRVLMRNEKEPLLVFESGAMTPKENWDTLLNHLPNTISWITYDRPGIGQSQEDSAIKTDIDIAKHLNTLLQSIKAAPPYILIGHSYGGPLIRLFTALYPSEVSGLVFIDPTDFMWTQKNEESLKKISNNAIGFVGASEKLFATLSSNTTIPKGHRSELNRILSTDISNYFIEYTSLPPLPNIPLTVFLAYNSPSNSQQDAMMKQFNINSSFYPELNKIRINNFLKLIENCSNGSLICVPKFMHYMHLQDPMIIANGIQAVYDNALKQK
jgi:pimeloyl-ACP methyl ester carboxylesterase